MSAVIRALASEPPPESAEPWRSTLAGAAADLLPEGRLAALLAEPAIAKAVAWGARGVQCTVVSGAGSPSHSTTVVGHRSGRDATRPAVARRQKQLVIVDDDGPLDRWDTDWRSGPRQASQRHLRDQFGDRDDSCGVDGDCPQGQYCDSTQSCYTCSYITTTNFDDVSGDCCSVAFQTQCPSNPAQCNC